MNKTDVRYLIGDGDNVRKHIDRLMLSAKFDSLKKLSNCIDDQIKSISGDLEKRLSANIIYANGDGFLAILPIDGDIAPFIENAQRQFFENCGINISFGIGGTIEDCLISLKKAKSI